MKNRFPITSTTKTKALHQIESSLFRCCFKNTEKFQVMSFGQMVIYSKMVILDF